MEGHAGEPTLVRSSWYGRALDAAQSVRSCVPKPAAARQEIFLLSVVAVECRHAWPFRTHAQRVSSRIPTKCSSRRLIAVRSSVHDYYAAVGARRVKHQGGPGRTQHFVVTSPTVVVATHATTRPRKRASSPNFSLPGEAKKFYSARGSKRSPRPIRSCDPEAEAGTRLAGSWPARIAEPGRTQD